MFFRGNLSARSVNGGLLGLIGLGQGLLLLLLLFLPRLLLLLLLLLMFLLLGRNICYICQRHKVFQTSYTSQAPFTCWIQKYKCISQGIDGFVWNPRLYFNVSIWVGFPRTRFLPVLCHFLKNVIMHCVVIWLCNWDFSTVLGHLELANL